MIRGERKLTESEIERIMWYLNGHRYANEFKGNMKNSFQRLMNDNDFFTVKSQEINADLLFINLVDTGSFYNSRLDFTSKMTLITLDFFYVIKQKNYYLKINEEEFEFINDYCLVDKEPKIIRGHKKQRFCLWYHF